MAQFLTPSLQLCPFIGDFFLPIFSGKIHSRYELYWIFEWYFIDWLACWLLFLGYSAAYENGIIYQNVWLVVWLPFSIFPYIGNVIIPIDEVIFFRGVAEPPTRCGFLSTSNTGLSGPLARSGPSRHQDRYTEIDRDNRILLKKMPGGPSEIATSVAKNGPPLGTCWNQGPLSHSGVRYGLGVQTPKKSCWKDGDSPILQQEEVLALTDVYSNFAEYLLGGSTKIEDKRKRIYL